MMKPINYAQTRRSRPPSRGKLVAIGLLAAVCLIVATAFLLVGGMWLYTIGFTDDARAHHGPVLVPLGFLAVVIGGACFYGGYRLLAKLMLPEE